MSNQGAIERAVDRMMDDVKFVIADAARKIAKQVEEDYKMAARSAVDNYYASYTPTSYVRQGELYGMYKAKARAYKNGNNWIIKASVVFDSDLIEGKHHSNSSLHNGAGGWGSGGDVDAEWIFENFMEGRHPITTPELKDGELEYIYSTIDDSVTPLEILENFNKNYKTQYFDKHIQNELMSQLQRRLDFGLY